MNDVLADKHESSFPDFENQIAAHARQLFRAICAFDTKAVEVVLFYFRGFLVKVLSHHLRNELRWNASERWLDGLGAATPEIMFPDRMRLRDKVVWATRDQQHWYEEPFEFELELCPLTGMFRQYTFRFGDSRLLAEKELLPQLMNSQVDGPDDNEWTFVFHRERN